MPSRHRHRIGRHLVTDDYTGHTYYDDEMIQIWDGSIVHRRHFETRQPQEFVQAMTDPQPVSPHRPTALLNAVSLTRPTTVGNTDTAAPQGLGGPGWRYVIVSAA